MCDMPADSGEDALVLRLWPVSEVNGNWTSVGAEEFAGVGPLTRSSSSPPWFSFSQPHIRQGYPLNLSISLSGGKENKCDSPSNGE